MVKGGVKYGKEKSPGYKIFKKLLKKKKQPTNHKNCLSYQADLFVFIPHKCLPTEYFALKQ